MTSSKYAYRKVLFYKKALYASTKHQDQGENLMELVGLSRLNSASIFFILYTSLVIYKLAIKSQRLFVALTSLQSTMAFIHEEHSRPAQNVFLPLKVVLQLFL